MTTRADEIRNDARDGVKSAALGIAEILFAEPWGHEEYTAEYVAKLREALGLLVTVQEKLG